MLPSMAKGLGRRDLVQDLETGVRLEYSGGPNINTRILTVGEGYIRGSQSDAKLGLSPLLLSLQMDKGNHKPRNVGSL